VSIRKVHVRARLCPRRTPLLLELRAVTVLLWHWACELGAVDRSGVEGTGAYGAGRPRSWTTRASRWSRSIVPIARLAADGASPTRSTPTPLPGQS